jgi:hypothetical protein
LPAGTNTSAKPTPLSVVLASVYSQFMSSAGGKPLPVPTPTPPTPTPTPKPTPTPTPGHGSPEAAVQGYISDILASNYAASCVYVDPSWQSTCEAFSGDEGATTGTFAIQSEITQGTAALVSVTGQECQAGSQCASNANPTAGMPSSSAGFAIAYTAAVNAISPNSLKVSFSPVPCIDINGSWYINLGSGSSGSTGSTGTTGTTGSGSTGNTGTGNSGLENSGNT